MLEGVDFCFWLSYHTRRAITYERTKKMQVIIEDILLRRVDSDGILEGWNDGKMRQYHVKQGQLTRDPVWTGKI